MQNNEQRGSLSEKFRDFGAAPSPESWGAIEERLEQRKKRRVPIWWWAGAGAATIAFSVFLLLPEHNPKIAASSGKQLYGIAKNTPLPIVRDTMPENLNSLFIPFWNFGPFQGLNFNFPYYSTCHASYYPDGYPYFHDSNRLILQDSSTQMDVVADGHKKDLPDDTSQGLTTVSQPEDMQLVPKPRNRKWLIGLNYGAAYRTGSNMVVPPTNDGEIDGLALIPEEMVSPSSNSTFKYAQSIELTVGRQLFNRLTIVSGLYAGMYSTGKVEGNSSAIYGHTTARAIGVPLSVEYDVLRKNRFTISPGAGLMHQWISHINAATTLEDAASSITTSSMEASRYQSTILRGYIAFRYRVFRNAWLEMKPVISYFPENKSVQTVTFPEKRCWIGGTGGLVMWF